MKILSRSIKEELKKHYLDYLILIIAGIIFIIGLNFFKGEKWIQFIIILAFSSFYIIWGTYHHLTKTGIRLKIMIEYILIGFIILFLLKIILIQ